MSNDTSRLKRPLNPMPPHVEQALVVRGLMDAYLARPAYQRNDYLGWISRAREQATRDKRLQQMLDELASGDVYMNMRWQPRHSPGDRTRAGSQ